jgi:hypothetical protein
VKSLTEGPTIAMGNELAEFARSRRRATVMIIITAVKRM